MSLVHTAHIRIEKKEGPHRVAWIEQFQEPVHYGIHGGVRHFYKEKYGKDLGGPERPSTLDHIISAVAG